MKTRVIRTAVTELDEDEAYDLAITCQAFTDKGVTKQTPTAKQLATTKLFAEQLMESLG